MKGRRRQAISVKDRMQNGYRYERVAPIGRNFHPEFRPELTPKQMLELGVFCGKYMTDARKEFPASWFTRARYYMGRRMPEEDARQIRRWNAMRRHVAQIKMPLRTR